MYWTNILCTKMSQCRFGELNSYVYPYSNSVIYTKYFNLTNFFERSLSQLMFMLYKFKHWSVCLWWLIRPESRSDSEIKHHTTEIEESRMYLMSSALHWWFTSHRASMTSEAYTCLAGSKCMNFHQIWHIHTYPYFPSSPGNLSRSAFLPQISKHCANITMTPLFDPRDFFRIYGYWTFLQIWSP